MPYLPISRLISLIVLLALLLSKSTAGAVTWREEGDVNVLPATAQPTTGYGCLTVITGGLSAKSDVDMYTIDIVTPALLSIDLQCTANGGPDIWLFDSNGIGVATNSTCAAGSKPIPSTFVTAVGTYYVAVASRGMEPYAGALPIWTSGGTGPRAPNGTGAAGAVTNWVDTGAVLTDTTYRIELVGTNFHNQMPAPMPDYNGDGLYDACDEIALDPYYRADDWRANLNRTAISVHRMLRSSPGYFARQDHPRQPPRVARRSASTSTRPARSSSWTARCPDISICTSSPTASPRISWHSVSRSSPVKTQSLSTVSRHLP